MASVFFSYSHRDEALRNELEIHLAPLKRQGIVDTWHDRRIGAGEEVDPAINAALESSDIILLLVSPYFMASNYCYDREMSRAMARHASGDARVIPVILDPCDWRSTPFGKLLAVPEDGKPITKFANQHDGFLQVAQAIRNATEELGKQPILVPTAADTAPPSPTALTEPQIRSSNLRLKKKFSDQERDQFVEDAFVYIARFFENSLGELVARNSGIDSRFRQMDANHFTAKVYTDGSTGTECKIWLSAGSPFSGSIVFSHAITASDNSFNESLSVVDDGYTLSLKPMMSIRTMRTGRQDDANLTPQGAAEYFWEIFIERLQ